MARRLRKRKRMICRSSAMSVTIHQGDCREVLKTLPDASVDCCVTSPPYFGLRDYGACSCRKGRVQHESSTLSGSQAGTPNHLGTACPACGGTGRLPHAESQIGVEATPEQFVFVLVAVFREVRRVLRDDGTLWLNLGDAYAGGGRGGNPEDSPHRKQSTNAGSLVAASDIPDGLKAKDLMGIPWRVAFALQADGWYLRQDIIWHKPNPMPESVTDRCTKAHEYIFLLSKSPRYYYDQDSIKVPATMSTIERLSQNVDSPKGSDRVPGKTNGPMKAVGKIDKQRGHSRSHAGFNDRWDAMEKAQQCSGTVNKRSVWTVATRGYDGAHFATFPPELIRPCVLAGCKVGGVVLDPFGGSGTTGEVAEAEGRNSVLIELNPQYVYLAEQRTAQRGLFAGVNHQ